MSFEVLYIHVPFCKRRCRYCDFASSAAKYGDLRAFAYANKIASYLNELAKTGLLSEISTAYVGGGTPSMLGFETLPALLASVSSYAQLQEFSFEANPDSLDKKLLKRTKSAGATRVSIGVQSFVDNELEALGRIHSAQTAEQAVTMAVRAGFDVSLDLMCGIPYQSPESWQYSLSRALELGIGHISIYPLMIEEGTEMERLCETGELPWPDDDLQATYMEIAECELTKAGFIRYEVASYAKPHKQCKHNCAYWTGKEYLGLGTSGASMMGRQTYECLRAFVPNVLPVLDSSTYRVRVSVASPIDEIISSHGLSDLAYEIEQLTGREAAAEDLMLAARMSAGISRDLYERAAEVIPRSELEQTFDKLEAAGLLNYLGTSWQPTHTGWLRGNEVYGPLWGLAEE